MSRSQRTRRDFLSCSTTALLAGSLCAGKTQGDENAAQPASKLRHAIGIVSASAATQLAGRAQDRNFTLLELPQILREELDLTVIDLNTSSFPSFDDVDAIYVEKLRAAADKAGCVLTNLKMNQRGFDMNSPDRDTRQRAITEYKRSIDVASQLGCRWVRPLPQNEKPDLAIHVASYQELCDYAAKRNIQLLVENCGWMQADADSVPNLVQAIGRNVAACPDTGNWNSSALRYAGLARTFPIAVTCDFKAKQLRPNGDHAAYDLKRCFDIAWQAGFRGPWAIEHGNPQTAQLLSETALVRDMLRTWMAAAPDMPGAPDKKNGIGN